MGFLNNLFKPADDSKKDDDKPTSDEKKKEKERKWADLQENEKFVCEGGKVLCKFCSNPSTKIVVTSNTVHLQDKFYATNKDKTANVNISFDGDCYHPSQQKPSTPPPPCKITIALGDWKDYSDTKINNDYALLVKSTIPCTKTQQDLSILHSGQKSQPKEVKPVPPKKPVMVTFGKIIRGNPYVSKNAKDVGLPASIPLNKTYEVKVTVKGKGTVNLAIVGSSPLDGDATVTPATITKTTIVTVTGTLTTLKGYDKRLKIEAKEGTMVRAVSEGFSVCSHPLNFQVSPNSDVNLADRVGFVIEGETMPDGSGPITNIKIKESVVWVKSDSPPFSPMGAHNQNPQFTNSHVLDTHTVGRPSAGPKGGTCVFDQLFTFKCESCNSAEFVMPKSGYRIEHTVFKDGNQWKHKIRKYGKSVTIGTFSTKAGVGDLTSVDHNLP